MISGIVVMDMQGLRKMGKVRALLDSGAGTNFVAAEALNYVRFEKIATEILTIQGINTDEPGYSALGNSGFLEVVD